MLNKAQRYVATVVIVVWRQCGALPAAGVPLVADSSSDRDINLAAFLLERQAARLQVETQLRSPTAPQSLCPHLCGAEGRHSLELGPPLWGYGSELPEWNGLRSSLIGWADVERKRTGSALGQP